MNTPAAALTWELWRRHRPRLLIIGGLLLTFALVYPKLCALEGLNLAAPSYEDDLVSKFLTGSGTPPSLLKLGHALYIFFLSMAPVVAMILTLLYWTWIFTFAELDPKFKQPTFPVRVFTLPITTSFLFLWLLFIGMAGLALLYLGWTCLVPFPHFGLMREFPDCLSWLTLLAMTQAIVWGLAGFPILRALLLATLLWTFLGWRYWIEFLHLNAPAALLPLFLMAAAVAYGGLRNLRCGQWQGWTWQGAPAIVPVRAEAGGPKRFSSPAQAQLWFEWRQYWRSPFLTVAALATVPVLIHLLIRTVCRLGPLEPNTIVGFVVLLATVTGLMYFLMSFARSDRMASPFLLIRPLNNGDMVMAKLKAAAISVVLSWTVILAALGALPLLGDTRMLKTEHRLLMVLGVIFLTWRCVGTNLWCTLTGSRRLAAVPFFAVYAGGMAAAVFFYLFPDSGYQKLLEPTLLAILATLVAVKFLLAFLAFRAALKRRLLTVSSLTGYLAVWALLVAALLVPVLVATLPGLWTVVQMETLGIIVAVPLARIGFCPMALNLARHR